jgi:hypothetical protein
MLLVLAVVLALAWVLAFGVYQVSSLTIHLLVVAALAALTLHFVRGVDRRRFI